MSTLLGRKRLDPEGVDVALHEVAQCLINHAMPRHGALAAEGLGNDRDLPVASATGPRSRVARMLRAFVAQIQRHGLQRGEPLADDLRARHLVPRLSLSAD